MAKPPIATTFSLWTKSITLNGRKYYHQHSWSSFKTKHTFKPTKDTAWFVENFNTALQKWENFALIGKYKGNDVKIYFNNNFANHFIKHWGFKAENLVETINNYDAVNIWGKNRYIFEKELPNGKWLRAIRAITTKNFSEITFFETKNKFKWWEVIEKGLDKLREWAETKKKVLNEWIDSLSMTLRIDKIAKEKWFNKGNHLVKMIDLNKSIKKGSWKRSLQDKEIYKLKDEILMDQIIKRWKVIKDMGEDTTFTVRHKWVSVEWHLWNTLRYKLKKLWLLK